jgi:hypothetical protein
MSVTRWTRTRTMSLLGPAESEDHEQTCPDVFADHGNEVYISIGQYQQQHDSQTRAGPYARFLTARRLGPFGARRTCQLKRPFGSGCA